MGYRDGLELTITDLERVSSTRGVDDPTPAAILGAFKDMRQILQQEIGDKGLSISEAAREIGYDSRYLSRFLKGITLLYAAGASKIIAWLPIPIDKRTAWMGAAAAYERWVRRSRTQHVALNCFVCGKEIHIPPSHISRPSPRTGKPAKYQPTCSVEHRRLAPLKFGLRREAGPQWLFGEILAAGSVAAYKAKSGLSGNTLSRLCTESGHAPDRSTLSKLRLTGRATPEFLDKLFPIDATSRRKESMQRLLEEYPRGSAKWKLNMVKGARTRRGRKQSEQFRLAARKRALHQLEDADYYQGAVARLEAARSLPSYRALRLLLLHILRTKKRLVPLRTIAPGEIRDEQLRQWAAEDEPRVGLPAGYLIRQWKMRLRQRHSKGGRPQEVNYAEIHHRLKTGGTGWVLLGIEYDKPPESLRVGYREWCKREGIAHLSARRKPA